MSKKKYKTKYEPVYSFDTKIPFKKLVKGSLLINFAPILIIFIFTINGYLPLTYAAGLTFSIYLLSLLFIYPYMADLHELTKYVGSLASNKKVKKPSLSFLNNVEELSGEINALNEIWEQKNRRLERNLKKEQKTQQMMHDFVANASHEMKTPLASIGGFTETILDMDDNSKDKEKFLKIIQNQSKRLESLIAELLILSKLEDKIMEEDKPIDLPQMMENIGNNLLSHITEKEIRFSTKTPKTIPVVKGSEPDLTRAVENLVSNAIRYNKPKTKIGIITNNINKLDKKFKVKNKYKKYLKITVKDDGVGIAKSEIPRLTERFYRVDKARSRKVGGSGLGLSIVSQIAENHNGFLDIKSTLGKGSEFSIYLPVK